MNLPPPMLDFAVTRRGMSRLGHLLSIPTAGSGIPTVFRPRLPLLRSTHSAPASLRCNLGLPASPQGREITAHGVSRVEHLAPPAWRSRKVQSRCSLSITCKPYLPKTEPDSSLAGIASSRLHPAAGCGMVINRKSTRLNSSHLGISYAVFC